MCLVAENRVSMQWDWLKTNMNKTLDGGHAQYVLRISAQSCRCGKFALAHAKSLQEGQAWPSLARPMPTALAIVSKSM
jgi:hypothetical protein